MRNDKALASIRRYMTDNKIDACVIPSTDPHMGEYIPRHWASREWVSGFTGSAGTVVITSEFAGLWTDSRYFIQAVEQLEGRGIELVKLKIPHTPEHLDWLAENLPAGSTVVIDGEVISLGTKKLIDRILGKKGIKLNTGIDIPGQVWDDRPPLPKDKIFDHSIEYCGEKREDKIARLQKEMKKLEADYTLVCTLDEIAWLFNLRGTDISFNPVFVSYAVISQSEAILFIDPEKVPCELMKEMQKSNISFMDYTDIKVFLAQLQPGKKILFDPGKTSYSVISIIPESCEKVEGPGLATQMKAIKNDTEVRNLRKVMIKDGIAWVKFLHWINKNIGVNEITELSAARKLESFREEQENYMGASFHPISSFAHHGAVVHYSVDEESSIELKPNNIYLCDTGGQYLDGTTDTTRTITLGETSDEQKSDFTLALKGTIGLSMLRFPRGTKGYQMDILARKALWDNALNYGHGTGHGVGFFLNVHEGPQTIGTGASGQMDTPLLPGMVTTIEPAIYREGKHGMRTENITLVVEDVENEYASFLKFETLTLAPIDLNLVKAELLSREEKTWLNNYHQTVLDLLAPHLSGDELEWLKANCREI